MNNQEWNEEVVKPVKPHKWRSRLLTVLLVIVIAGGGFIAGQVVLLTNSSGNLGISNLKVLYKLSWLEAYVDKFFLDDTDEETLENSVYKGFIAGLNDPYAAYYTKEEYEQLMEEDSGEYMGIGVTVRKDTATGYVVVEQINKDGPAYNAGVQTGDMIVSVDGTDTSGISLQETVSAIKKDEQPVVLSILRNGQAMEITVDKSQIKVESVSWEMKENNIGYISVSQFVENTAEQFDQAVTDLENQGMTGLIIDLRDNGGGLLSSCLDMVSRLIPEGKLIVYTEDKEGKKTEYNSDSDKVVDVPMVVLVNENSASASEIMTGCLKDYGTATIVGEKTYGKGIVQNIFPLQDGSAVKMTVSKYYTPNGNNIHGVGIEPDVTVKMGDKKWAKARKEESKDTQLQKAYEILK